MNRIIAIHCNMLPDGSWEVITIKEFAPENGGGTQSFREHVPASSWSHSGLHRALDVAKGMATMSPGSRTDLAEVAR